MATDLLYASAYTFNLLSLPSFIVAFLCLCLGIFIIIREGFYLTSVSYFILSLIFTVWFGSYGMMYMANEPGVAHFWANAAHLALPFIPAAGYMLTVSILLIYPRRRWLSWLFWLIGLVFVVGQLYYGLLFEHLYHYVFGFYPNYQLISTFFVGYLAAVLVLCVIEYVVALKNCDEKTRYYYRTENFLTAFLIGYLAGIDMIPVYGVNILPLGFLPIFAFLITVAYTVIQYRLIDITSRFAVDKILNTMVDPLLVFDTSLNIKVFNSAASQLLGYRTEELYDKPLSEIFPQEHRKTYEQFRSSEEPENMYTEVSVLTKEGNRIEANLSFSPLHDPKLEYIMGHVLVIRDIRAYKRVERRLAYLAEHDSLTGLYNRRGFFNAMESQLKHRPRQSVALMWLDINQFKLINDSLSHEHGDQLLRQLSTFINHSFGFDICARIGGDEFALVKFDAVNYDIERLAQIVVSSIQAKNFNLGNQHVRITSCLGVAIYPVHGKNPNELLAHADRAIYWAKKIGPNHYFMFSMDEGSPYQHEIERSKQVRQALTEKKLKLHAQPIYDIANEQTSCYELLLRLVDYDGTIVQPVDFLQAAENYGLMGEINRYVISETIDVMERLTKAGYTGKVSFNIGGNALMDTEFLNYFKEKLRHSNVDSQRLVIEMTETVIITNIDYAYSFISACRELGLKFALDDFGVGMSSLNHIKLLPVDIIKVDGSFIMNLLDSDVDFTIVNAIARLAQILNINTVAEFVKDKKTLEKLGTLSFTHAQGYYFGKPVPISDIETYYLEQSGDDS